MHFCAGCRVSDLVAQSRASKYTTDPTCAVKFHTDQFLKSFFYHFFFPLSAPVIICLDGQQALTNMFLIWIFSAIGFFSVVLMPVMIWSLVIIFALQGPNADARGGILASEVGLMLGVYTMRILTISFKYAYCARCEWRRLLQVGARESLMR